MPDYSVKLTDYGRAAIAQAETAGTPIVLTEIAVGDSQSAPTVASTALGNEVHRTDILESVVDVTDPALMRFTTTIPANVGGFWIREVGVFDSTGGLVYVAAFPEEYKPLLPSSVAKECVIHLLCTVGNAANVTVVVDGSVVYATQDMLLEYMRKDASNAPFGVNRDARSQKASASSLPRLLTRLKDYRNDLQTPINIVGFGSSVGVGATLPDPATQAPVAHFASRLNAVFDPLSIFNFVTYNRSVNGSVVAQVIQDDPNPTGYWDSYIAEGHGNPALVVFAYGMNDGGTANYNSGQTYPWFYLRLVEAIRKAQIAGSDVIILTTPHPRSTMTWSMPVDIPQYYPAVIDAPVSDNQIDPPASQSQLAVDILGLGVSVPVSHRHYRVNQAMRAAAIETGAALIDAEKYWFEAVAIHGENTLFNGAEVVHPNLLGHQLSYQRAIDDFILALAASTQQAGGWHGHLAGSMSINTVNENRALTARQETAGKKIAGFEKADGTVVVEVDENGNVIAGNVRFDATEYRNKIVGSAAADPYTSDQYVQNYNLGPSSPVIINHPTGMGKLMIEGFQNGVGHLLKEYTLSFDGANTVLTQLASVGAGAVFAVTVAGATITITPGYDNTNIKYWHLRVKD